MYREFIITLCITCYSQEPFSITEKQQFLISSRKEKLLLRVPPQISLDLCGKVRLNVQEKVPLKIQYRLTLDRSEKVYLNDLEKVPIWVLKNVLLSVPQTVLLNISE